MMIIKMKKKDFDVKKAEEMDKVEDEYTNMHTPPDTNNNKKCF
jgi:hypothetical protein